MKDFWRLFKKEAIFILLILFTLLLFFNKIIFRNQIYITGDFLRSDTLHQNLPLKFILYQSWRSGKIPFWTEGIFNGFPLLAEGQMGFFYPFNFLPALIFPFATAYNLSIFLNFFWAALGMFFLARSFNLSRATSFLSSIAFTLSSFFVLHLTHHPVIAVSAWLPWLLLTLLKYFEQKRFKYLFFSALIIAIEVFTGYFQLILYSFFLLLVFFLFYQKKISSWRLIGTYLLIWLLGMLLAAFQILPTLELVGQSVREKGLSYIVLEGLPYHPRNLITLIFPYIFGDPGRGTYPHFGGSWGMFWENTAYVGLITLVLAFLSILSKVCPQKRTDLILRFLFLISILLALGKYGPLFWIYYLPGFNLFRVTARFLLFVVFSLSLLAGFGLELVCQKIKNFYLKTMVNFFVLLVLLIDLFLFGYNYNPTAKAELILEKPPAAKFLEKQLGKGERIFSVGDFLTYDEINKNGWRNNLKDTLNHKNSLGPNINMLWGIENSDGYVGLFLRRNEMFKNLIYQGMKINEDKIEISPSSLKLLGLANTKFLISAFDILGEGIERIKEFAESNKTYKVYKNNFYLPKGVLIDNYKSGDLEAIFNRLSSQEFSPQNELLVEAFPIRATGKKLINQILKEGVKLKKETEGSFVFNVSSNSSRWFLLQETHYPGWTAYVNGKETPIYPADGMFMAIQVPAGKSVAEFVYQPMSFYVGVFISILTLLILIVVVISNPLDYLHSVSFPRKRESIK